jgi:hypothetical protein
MSADRHWWEATPRDGFTAEARVHRPEIERDTPKAVTEWLRWQEEHWAVVEARSLGMKQVVYR